MSFTAVARVQMLIEVDVGGFGEGWTLTQVHQTAETSARERIAKAFAGFRDVRVLNVAGVNQVIARKEEP